MYIFFIYRYIYNIEYTSSCALAAQIKRPFELSGRQAVTSMKKSSGKKGEPPQN